jgi:hypothetical protein
MDFDIRNLAEALSFEVDDTVRLERFVDNNRRLRNQLANQAESLAHLTANFAHVTDSKIFIESIEAGGYSSQDAWSRLDEIEELSEYAQLQDLLDLIIAIADRARSGIADPNIKWIAERVGLQIS